MSGTPVIYLSTDMFLRDHVCCTNRLSRYQVVRISHGNGQSSKSYGTLLDTGSDHNFIRRSVVEDLKLDIIKVDPKRIEAFGQNFLLDEGVQPTWRLEKGVQSHKNTFFYVKAHIAGDIDMLLSDVTLRELGIHLAAYHVLVVQADSRGSFHFFLSQKLSLNTNASASIDTSTIDKERKQHKRRARDVTASEAKARKEIEAEYAEMVSQIKTANATEVMQPRNPTSQQNAAGSNDGHRR